jgi:hypothetical protein
MTTRHTMKATNRRGTIFVDAGGMTRTQTNTPPNVKNFQAAKTKPAHLIPGTGKTNLLS